MSVYDNLPIQVSKIKQSDDDSKVKYIYSIDIYNQLEESLNDSYIVSKKGDRFDLLADQFYDDENMWDIIAIHNPEAFKGSLVIDGGYTLRIPYNPQSYNQINRNINDNR